MSPHIRTHFSTLYQHLIHFFKMLSSSKIKEQFKILPQETRSNYSYTMSEGRENPDRFLHILVLLAKGSNEFSVVSSVGILERKQVKVTYSGASEKRC